VIVPLFCLWENLMDWKIIAATFGVVFLAELGDKTQLATFNLACANAPASVFIGSAGALVVTSLIAVIFGGFLQEQKALLVWVRRVAAVIFIVIGVMMLMSKEA